MAKSAWGIELGTSSVKAVKVTGDRGSATLEEVEIVSLADFGLGSGTSHEDATSGALNDLRTRKGIKRDDTVYVSISGQNTLGRIISLPPVSNDKIRETILNEARSQIPIKLEEAVWDYQVIEDADPEERKVNLYAAKRDAVQKILDTCENAGLQIKGVQVAPLGIYNYIKYEMDDNVSDCCVAIDIGADNTDVVIIDGQKTYVRVVPVAGNDITKALRARFKLPADQAEKLKRNAAKSKDAAAVFEAMKPPLKEMVGEIYRAVGFYKSQNEDANINQLVMMGNGSKLLNIKKFFEQQLQYHVHKVDTPQRLALARTVDPSEVQNTIQSLCVAIGLGLQGIGLDGLNSINLIPPEYLSAKATEKLRLPFFVGGGIAAAGGVIALLMGVFATSGVDPMVSAAQGLSTAASARDAEYRKHVTVGDAQHKVRSLRNLVEAQIAALPVPKDGEVQPPPIPLTVRSNLLPGIVADSVHSALQQHVARQGESNRTFYAHMPQKSGGGASGDSILNSTVMWMTQVSEPAAYTPFKEGETPVFMAKRTLTCRTNIAMELSGGGSSQSMNDTLKTALGEINSNGLLATELKKRLTDYFRESGQLAGAKDAEIAKIKWEPWVSISVNVVPVSVISSSQQAFMLKDIVPDTGDLEMSENRSARSNKPAPSASYAVSEVTVRITLEPAVKPEAPAEGE
ncbi:MAG: type IV pilus assembly protein PilM [Planctomycetes bacterium]|nr:type IV pilus assembly protein PilM [Planctomycetota bacterium]MCW8134779.1 type IV pilus assembly protein PilM [Planctomycetota bacterium]